MYASTVCSCSGPSSPIGALMTPTLASGTTPPSDDGYETWLSAVRAHFASSTGATKHLFTTDAAGLWETYLENAPPGERQTRTCATCRTFFERFGGLVTIR